MILNRILPTIEIILRKNRNGFRKSRSEEVRNRNLTAVLQLADFPEAFESIHRTKMKQILLAYVTRQERNVSAAMMFTKRPRFVSAHQMATRNISKF